MGHMKSPRASRMRQGPWPPPRPASPSVARRGPPQHCRTSGSGLLDSSPLSRDWGAPSRSSERDVRLGLVAGAEVVCTRQLRALPNSKFGVTARLPPHGIVAVGPLSIGHQGIEQPLRPGVPLRGPRGGQDALLALRRPGEARQPLESAVPPPAGSSRNSLLQGFRPRNHRGGPEFVAPPTEGPCIDSR